MIKSVTIHARIAEETRDLARVVARNKRLSDAAFYRLAIEEAVRKYRPKHKVEGPEIVESLPRMDLDFTDDVLPSPDNQLHVTHYRCQHGTLPYPCSEC